MDASNKQEGISEKFVRVWEKKNAKAARAGGVSLMALSLAACGSSSTTTTTSTDTSTDTTTTTVTPVSLTLTSGSDTVTGTSADDTISGARADTLITLNSGDVIDGGAGTDTLTATLNGGLATSSISNVENLVLTDLGAGEVVFATATATYISGVSDVKYVQSAGDITLTRISDSASITLDNVVDDVTVTFADSVLSGTDDTLTMNLNGFVLAGGNGGENLDVGSVSDTDGDIENLVINATGAASDLNDLDSAFVETTSVTVKGTAGVDFGATAAFTKLATFNSADSTGGMTLLLGADGVTGATNTKTLTFGAGADSLDLGVLAPADVGVVTVNMGGGNDTVDLDDFADATMVIGGGDGTDTLVSAAVITAANGSKITGFETFNLGANAGDQVMSNISSNVFSTLVAGAATTTFSNVGSSTSALHLAGGIATTAATLSRLVDGSADSLTVKAITADAALTGDLSIDHEETVTFDSSSFAIDVQGDITSTDLTSVTLVGDNAIALGTNGSKEFSSTKIATVDASGVTGTAAVEVYAINNTVAMTVTAPVSTGTFTFDGGSGIDTVTAGGGILDVDGGNGDDVLNGGAKADVLEGDGGNDTITGGEAADYIAGGTGVDTIVLTETTAASDEVELSSGAANYDIITGFKAGAGTGADNISALQATHGWNSTDNTTTVLLSSGATLKAADAAADSNIVTITTNVTAGTFDNFVAGTITEATMESNVITALGLTGGLDAAAKVLVFVDDGEDTGVFKFTSGDAATDDAVAASEIEIMAILDGIADASTILVGDVLFS